MSEQELLLTQEEIDALLQKMAETGEISSTEEAAAPAGEGLLASEKETLSEIFRMMLESLAVVYGNLSGEVLDVKNVEMAEGGPDAVGWDEGFAFPMNFEGGITGKIVAIVPKDSAERMATAMMGGMPPAEESAVTDALKELFSQTAGSAATKFGGLLKSEVRGTVTEGTKWDKSSLSGALEAADVKGNLAVVKGEIDGITIGFALPTGTAKDLVAKFVEVLGEEKERERPQPTLPAAKAPSQPAKPPSPAPQPPSQPSPQPSAAQAPTQPTPPAPQYPAPQQSPQQPMVYSPQPVAPTPPAPAVFPELRPLPTQVQVPKNIELLLDVPLEVSVELGRTKMRIRDILQLGEGSIIELNRLAGEPVDVLVNGKLIAKGEVVVIDENFAVRITSIISPEERLERLKT